MSRRTWSWSLILVLLGAGSGPGAAALALEVRRYFDEGPAAALPGLEALAAEKPDWRDVAWWRARCLLDLGRPGEALAALSSGGGERVPAWRFDALRAQASAWVGDAGAALAHGRSAVADLGDGAGEEPLVAQTRLLVAALAARAGQDDLALAQLLLLPGPPPALTLPAELELALPEVEAILAAPLAEAAHLSGPLAFQARGSWWRIETGGGIARRIDPPPLPVLECGGPDLCRPDGALLLPERGVRFSPLTHGERLWYAAGLEPLDPEPAAAGLFVWEDRAGAPTRLTRAPRGAIDLDPTPGPGGEVYFLRRTAAGTRLVRLGPDGEEIALAPDVSAIGGLARVGTLLVLGAVHGGQGELRALPVGASPDTPTEPLLAVAVDAWTPRALSPGGCGDAPR